jgi:hypothetical protein
MTSMSSTSRRFQPSRSEKFNLGDSVDPFGGPVRQPKVDDIERATVTAEDLDIDAPDVKVALDRGKRSLV